MVHSSSLFLSCGRGHGIELPMLAQLRDGKMPCRAMHQFITKEGWMLLCGSPPPLGDTDPGASVVVGALEVNAPMLKAARPCPWPMAGARPAAGNPAVALSAIAAIVWLWLGICVSSNVTVSSPPVSPTTRGVRPDPLP